MESCEYKDGFASSPRVIGDHSGLGRTVRHTRRLPISEEVHRYTHLWRDYLRSAPA